MVLLFLRDWRSVIVVVLNIPFALLRRRGRAVADRPDDQPDDAGRPGAGGRHPGRRGDRRGREHPHQMERTRSVARAVRRGNQQTAVPRLLAMLCVLAVFIPSFFMQGAAQALFVPLSLAVGFAMVASYLLSSTFVPVLSTWLLRHHHHRPARARARRLGLRAGPRRLRPGRRAASSAGAGWSCRRTSSSTVGVIVARRAGRSAWRSSPGSTPGGSSSACGRPTARGIEETEQLAIAALETIDEGGRPRPAWRSRSATSA